MNHKQQLISNIIQDWVLSSLEAGAWVNEEPFEMVTFSPAVKKIRLEKEATNGAFKSELFRGKQYTNASPLVHFVSYSFAKYNL